MAIILPGLSDTANINGSALLQLMPTIENLSFMEYHQILEKENVLVCTAPKFQFDLTAMQEANVEKSLFNKTSLILLSVDTRHFDSIDDIDWDDDYIYFFYSGTKLGNSYALRIASIEKSMISKSIKRYDALQRISKNFHVESGVKEIREYVKSKQFEEDKILAKMTSEDLGTEYRINTENIMSILTDGLPISE